MLFKRLCCVCSAIVMFWCGVDGEMTLCVCVCVCLQKNHQPVKNIFTNRLINSLFSTGCWFVISHAGGVMWRYNGVVVLLYGGVIL